MSKHSTRKRRSKHATDPLHDIRGALTQTQLFHSLPSDVIAHTARSIYLVQVGLRHAHWMAGYNTMNAAQIEEVASLLGQVSSLSGIFIAWEGRLGCWLVLNRSAQAERLAEDVRGAKRTTTPYWLVNWSDKKPPRIITEDTIPWFKESLNQVDADFANLPAQEPATSVPILHLFKDWQDVAQDQYVRRLVTSVYVFSPRGEELNLRSIRHWLLAFLAIYVIDDDIGLSDCLERIRQSDVFVITISYEGVLLENDHKMQRAFFPTPPFDQQELIDADVAPEDYDRHPIAAHICDRMQTWITRKLDEPQIAAIWREAIVQTAGPMPYIQAVRTNDSEQLYAVLQNDIGVITAPRPVVNGAA